jgi:hypothetical protein
MAFGAAALAALPLGRGSLAASGDYDAMMVNCIDPRFTDSHPAYMSASRMRGRFSQFVIAGGPLGAIHEKFASWHGTFWDNLNVSVELHNIKRVVALTHRDCGAARLALGAEAVATRAAETASHAEVLRAFSAHVGRRQPQLSVVTGIMNLDGGVDLVT